MLHKFIKMLHQAHTPNAYLAVCQQFKDVLDQPVFAFNNRSDQGQTLLHCAAVLDRVALARALITAGADLNARDAIGRTPLHRAAYHQAPDVLELLINAGADLQAADYDGATPLHLAVLSSFVPGLKLLTAAGTNLNIADKEGALPLHYLSDTLLDICENACYFTAEELLGAPHIPTIANATQLDSDVTTAPLTTAPTNQSTIASTTADNHLLQTLLYLLAQGSSVDVTDAEGNTVLIRTIIGGDPTVVAALLAHGANVNHTNLAGETALHWVVGRVYCDTSDACMELLLSHGAQIDLADHKGQTALDLARTTEFRTATQRAQLVRVLEQAAKKLD